MRMILAGMLLSGVFATAAHAADTLHPTVVELYESQGCSSCPPANAVLNTIAGRPELLALNFGVTYWDYLGWKDSFAQPGFTQRQRDYAHAAGRDGLSTPQMIVNGRGVLVGSNAREVDAALTRFDRGATGPEIGIAAHRVTIAAAPRGNAIIWLVRYDPHTIDVPIRAGENGGRTLPHRNVVRQLTEIGRWNGLAASFALPANRPGLESAILVQAGRGGPILAARRI
jgi:hypothetical protein